VKNIVRYCNGKGRIEGAPNTGNSKHLEERQRARLPGDLRKSMQAGRGKEGGLG